MKIVKIKGENFELYDEKGNLYLLQGEDLTRIDKDGGTSIGKFLLKIKLIKLKD